MLNQAVDSEPKIFHGPSSAKSQLDVVWMSSNNLPWWAEHSIPYHVQYHLFRHLWYLLVWAYISIEIIQQMYIYCGKDNYMLIRKFNNLLSEKSIPLKKVDSGTLYQRPSYSLMPNICSWYMKLSYVIVYYVIIYCNMKLQNV